MFCTTILFYMKYDFFFLMKTEFPFKLHKRQRQMQAYGSVCTSCMNYLSFNKYAPYNLHTSLMVNGKICMTVRAFEDVYFPFALSPDPDTLHTSGRINFPAAFDPSTCGYVWTYASRCWTDDLSICNWTGCPDEATKRPFLVIFFLSLCWSVCEEAALLSVTARAGRLIQGALGILQCEWPEKHSSGHRVNYALPSELQLHSFPMYCTLLLLHSAITGLKWSFHIWKTK